MDRFDRRADSDSGFDFRSLFARERIEKRANFAKRQQTESARSIADAQNLYESKFKREGFRREREFGKYKSQ